MPTAAIWGPGRPGAGTLEGQAHGRQIGAHDKMRDDPVLSHSTWVALVSLGYQDSNLD